MLNFLINNIRKMIEKTLVNELQKIKPKLEGDHANVAEMRQATTILARLAKSLHEKGKAYFLRQH